MIHSRAVYRVVEKRNLACLISKSRQFNSALRKKNYHLSLQKILYNRLVDHVFDLDTQEAIEEAFQETANKWKCVISVCWKNKHSVFIPKKEETPELPFDWGKASLPALGEGE